MNSDITTMTLEPRGLSERAPAAIGDIGMLKICHSQWQSANSQKYFYLTEILEEFSFSGTD